MKKILFIFSMLLAMGLTSACSSDDENPFVGEWQLVEVLNDNSGGLYPVDDVLEGEIIKFMPNFEFEISSETTSIEDLPPNTYSYDANILTIKYWNSGLYRSYKYSFSEKRSLLQLTDYKTNMDPDFAPVPRKIYTFKRK